MTYIDCTLGGIPYDLIHINTYTLGLSYYL